MNHKYLKSAMIFFAISVFCIVFTLIYERFSYGKYSLAMRAMFLIPLVMGVIPALWRLWQRKSYPEHRYAVYFWNTAIALFINGALMKGIIEISGRFTSYDKMYYIIGAICVICSVVLSVLSNQYGRKM